MPRSRWKNAKGDGLRLIRKQMTLHEMADAQDNRCPHCRDPLFVERVPSRPINAEHVIPRVKGGRDYGNYILAHEDCNQRKADSDPTGIELELLNLVNTRLEWNGRNHYYNTSKNQTVLDRKNRSRAKRGLPSFRSYKELRECAMVPTSSAADPSEP